MAQLLIVPILRASPVHIPRRDIVLSSGDSFQMRVTVVASDDVRAPVLELTGGLGGPSMKFLVWADGDRARGWDYGFIQSPGVGPLLLSITGIVSSAPGSFDIIVPAGSFNGLPRRCGWGLQMNWGSESSDMLIIGTVNFMVGTKWVGATGLDLLTDDSVPVLEDDTTPILAT